MVARSRAAVWHPCTQMKTLERHPLLPVARAEGPWLYDFDGRRYLDAVSSWWVNLFGHAHPHINAALREQLDSLEHVMLAGATHAPAVELAERLSRLAPGNLGHAFFASDGASATEIALKMSHHAWRNRGRPAKRRFVGLAGGYHGETLGALSVTDVAIFRDAYAPLVPDGSNWKATMLIEYPDPNERKRELARLIGVEDRMFVEVEGHARVYAIADEDLDRENADKTSSVHFLRFELAPAMIASLKAGAALAIGVDHPALTAAIRALPFVKGASPDAERGTGPVVGAEADPLAIGDGNNVWNLDAINVTDFGGTTRTVAQDGSGAILRH